MIYYAREIRKLMDHLTEVADLAKQFFDIFRCGRIADWAGLLHDLGKYTHTFYDFSGYDTF
jgi:HD superfamily phosphohydrolase YqeK